MKENHHQEGDALDKKSVLIGAKISMAQRSLFWFLNFFYPAFYKVDRTYLKDMCDSIQAFVEQNEKRILVVNVPPRHGKSFTATGLAKWLLGKFPWKKLMTGSYNETLSGTFARQVRNTIDTRKSSRNNMVYRDIFPNTKVKKGEASAQIWALEGSEEKSYLATSPSGTATGFGANVLLIDDIIKNSEEAYNENVLNKHWDWFTNTMMSRLEGDDWKIILIMTRWAKGDLAGRVIEAFPDDVKTITYSAIQEDGSMLCEEVLNERDYKLKTKEMSEDIVQANYNQKPIDVKGRLYNDFKVWDTKPRDKDGVEIPVMTLNYTDTADTGKDNLCSINYFVHNKEAYVTEIVYTDEAMEITEPLVVDLLYTGSVNRSIIESNNGGRGFARNIERLMKSKYNDNATVITPLVQSKNKEARILASSAWVGEHVYMPHNWKNKFPAFTGEVLSYQRKGKNAHDDGVDVLASIYEQITGKLEITIQSKTGIGLVPSSRRKIRKGSLRNL